MNVCLQVSKTNPRTLLRNTTKSGVSPNFFIDLIKPCKIYIYQGFLISDPLIFIFVIVKGQTAGPATQQTSNPDYNAWVDFYRQPMAFFNQGSQQTQAPGLQVRRDFSALLLEQLETKPLGLI